MEPLNLMVSLSHFANTANDKQNPKQNEHGLGERVRRRRTRQVAGATNARRVRWIRARVLP